MVPLQELKDWLGVTVPDLDDVLTKLEVRAVAFLEGEADRYFGPPKEFVEVLSPKGSDALWLRENPVSITKVEWRDFPGDTWKVLDPAAYETLPNKPRRIFLVDGSPWGAPSAYAPFPVEYVGWRTGSRTIRVTYQAGFPVGEEPESLKQVVLDLCSLKFRTKGKEGLRSEQIGDYRYELAGARFDESTVLDSIPGLRSTINRYRRKKL